MLLLLLAATVDFDPLQAEFRISCNRFVRLIVLTRVTLHVLAIAFCSV